jgi:hypothetical protein
VLRGTSSARQTAETEALASVVLPAVDAVSDEPEAMRFVSTLEVAAAKAGLRHKREAEPAIGGGDRPAVRLVRVDRP